MPILFKFYVYFRYKIKHTQTTSTTGHYAIHIIWGKEYEMVIWERNCKLRSWFLVHCFPLDFLNLQPFAPPHLNCYLRKHACPRKCIDRVTGIFENNFPTCGTLSGLSKIKGRPCGALKMSSVKLCCFKPTSYKWSPRSKRGRVWSGILRKAIPSRGLSSPGHGAYDGVTFWLSVLAIHFMTSGGWAFENRVPEERERHKADFCQPH